MPYIQIELASETISFNSALTAIAETGLVSYAAITAE
jgi:hypothetical protein